MDFFARQESARRRTWWLVALFFLALAGLILSAYVTLMAVVGTAAAGSLEAGPEAVGAAVQRWDPGMLAGVAAVISLIVFGGTAFKLSQLRQGGTVVADMLGGRRINPATTQFHERRLLNVVEEMALAAGVPVPPVYLLPGQMGINAFAAGDSINDAVVGITEGAMRGLKREELQGVIGHEFSHILNGDMRLNIRLIGILHGLLVLALVGRLMFRLSGRGGNSKKGGGTLLMVALGLALIIIGYAGYFFGGLIKRAVSRQREYLADASAVQFTRNPPGLANALKKIGGLASGAQVKSANTEEVSHLFFADGIQRLFGSGSLFATHPPLERRIRALEPNFDGQFPSLSVDALLLSGEESAPPSASKQSEAKGRAFIERMVMPGSVEAIHNPQSILQQVGVLNAVGMAAADQLLASMPPGLVDMTKEPIGAQAVILAMVLGESDQESSPFAWTWLPPFLNNAVDRAVGLLQQAGPEHRLPLVELALPALREMSRDQAVRFMETLEEIIKADNRVDLFEFAVREIIRVGLRETMGLPVTRIAVTSMTREVLDAAVVLLSLLAHSGTEQLGTAEAAFQAAMVALGEAAGVHSLKPFDLLSMDDAADALQRFLGVSMNLRRDVLAAALVCLQHDRAVTINELELFRTLATVMEVPVPPLALSGPAN